VAKIPKETQLKVYKIMAVGKWAGFSEINKNYRPV
jgi:hypothetical protein